MTFTTWPPPVYVNGALRPHLLVRGDPSFDGCTACGREPDADSHRVVLALPVEPPPGVTVEITEHDSGESSGCRFLHVRGAWRQVHADGEADPSGLSWDRLLLLAFPGGLLVVDVEES